jgi:hypothetical protein
VSKIFAGILNLAVLAAISLDVQAVERHHEGSYVRGNGQGGTYSRDVVREKGQRSATTNWTNNQGGQGSATHERTWNKDTGTRTSSRSATRPNGKTATWNKESQKTDTGRTAHGEGTNFRGQEVNMDRTVTKNGDGTRSVDSTWTNETTGKSVNIDKTVTKTDDGRISTGTYTTGAGNTGTVSGSTTHDGQGGTTHTNTFTNQDGENRTHTTTVDRSGTGATRSTSVTGFDGETRSRTLTNSPTTP